MTVQKIQISNKEVKKRSFNYCNPFLIIAIFDHSLLATSINNNFNHIWTTIKCLNPKLGNDGAKMH
jgi:hypothetical protein